MNNADSNSTAPRSRTIPILLELAAALVGVCLLRLFISNGDQLLQWASSNDVFNLRRRDVIMGLIVGSALATSGVGLQSLLRNPLADPWILGIASGAGLGMMCQHLIQYQFAQAAAGPPPTAPPLPPYVGALFGAAATTAIVFIASQRRGLIDPLGLLLTGVVLGALNGALIMLINYMAGPGLLRNNITNWMMGFYDANLSYTHLTVIGALAATGFAIFFIQARAMDVALFSEGEAQSLGVNIKALRWQLLVIPSVLTAAAVLIAGPIAFVGLISPHLARLLLGPAHRPLLVGAALIGGAIMVSANCASKIIDETADTGIIPLGVFTVLVGGPIFIFMLRPHLGKTEQ